MNTSRKKKRTRRSEVKYPALDPAYNLKTRQDLIEVDYINKLSETEKAWLNSFNEEYVNANFSHKGKKIQKKKKYRKDSYDRNNARNRDIFSREQAQGTLNRLDENITVSYEDELISKIDKEMFGEEE